MMLESDTIPLLDCGYIKLIEYWGSEERIIEGARTSTGGGFVSWEPYKDHPKGDLGLLQYLWKNGHTSPFEMAGLMIEVKAPIFVFREWHRHRTQSYGEASARYMPLPNQNYLPNFQNVYDRIITASKNKQERGIEHKIPSVDDIRTWLHMLDTAYHSIQTVYETGLRLGIPKELARLPVPVARYSVMRANANLLNWLRFLRLRLAINAQWEIRQYANAVSQFIGHRFPRTFTCFMNSIEGEPDANSK